MGLVVIVEAQYSWDHATEDNRGAFMLADLMLTRNDLNPTKNVV